MPYTLSIASPRHACHHRRHHAGVTRQSILDLAREWGDCTVSERPFTIHDVVSACKEGRLLECFGAGTAAVVSPVKLIHYDGVDYNVPLDPKDASAGAGPFAKRVWDTLSEIQYGRRANHPWSVPLE